jgi:uncharacterized protein
MNRPIIVIDTNVFVSAALKLSSNEASVVLLIAEQKIQLVVSSQILEEYHNVLFRPRLRIDHNRLTFLLSTISREAVLLQPTLHLSISPHEPDNRFLECAEAAEADYLVTGNKRHFPDHWKNTEVVNARELLDRLKLS